MIVGLALRLGVLPSSLLDEDPVMLRALAEVAMEPVEGPAPAPDLSGLMARMGGS